MIHRRLTEWGRLPHGDGENAISETLAESLVRVADRAAAVGGSSALHHARDGLHARSIVGIISSPGCSLEILPKIDSPEGTGDETDQTRRVLVHMLATALGLRINVAGMANVDWQRETLLDILIRLFADRLADVLRQGMPRQYRGREDDLPALRGRSDVIRQFSILAANPGKLASVFSELTPDIALNQIMKAAVRRLSTLARRAETQRRLRELLLIYADIEDVAPQRLHWNEVHLDRSSERWRELLELARLLLGNRFQATSSGAGSGYALLFDMNLLFEQFIAAQLGRALVGTALTVVAQGGRRFCLRDEENVQHFQTRPDILIKQGTKVVQVIDTKWKRVSGRLSDERAGVSQADVYQMMAYGQIYGCTELKLVYPHHGAAAYHPGARSRAQVVGQAMWLSVELVDITDRQGLRQQLRRLAQISSADLPGPQEEALPYG